MKMTSSKINLVLISSTIRLKVPRKDLAGQNIIRNSYITKKVRGIRNTYAIIRKNILIITSDFYPATVSC